MQIITRRIKELVIAVVIVIVMLVAGYFLFRNHFQFLSSDIPNAVKYEGINQSEYLVKGSIEDETDPTRRYEANNNSLRAMAEERRVSTGAPNPFVASETVDTDLPSEIVTIKNELGIDYDVPVAVSGEAPAENAEAGQ